MKVVETDVNGETSENDSVDKDKNRGGRDKAIVKGKGKGKSKVAGTEMDVEWDYNLASVAVTLPSELVKPPARNAFVLGSH